MNNIRTLTIPVLIFLSIAFVSGCTTNSPGTSTVSVSGTISQVIRSGSNVPYTWFTVNATNITIYAYADSAMTQVVRSVNNWDCSTITDIGSVEYTVSGLSPNTTYYIKAYQDIHVNVSGADWINKGTVIATPGNSDLTGQNITFTISL